MKYFEYIIILMFFLTAVAILYYSYKNLRSHHFCRLIWKAVVTKNYEYLPSYYLFKMIRELTFSTDSLAQKALVYLSVGRFGPALRYFKKKHKLFFVLVLEAIKNPENSLKKFEKEVKTNPNNQEMLVELVALYFINKNLKKGRLALERIDDKKLSDYGCARKLYYQSFLNIDEGDLLEASQNVSLAIKIFHKKKAYYEEAQAYLLMGIIYRISVVADVSQVMFEAARDLFAATNSQAETAAVYGNLGMLMAIQSRFEEAADYYQKAEDLNKKINLQLPLAEINNQQALLELLRGNISEAKKLATTALGIHLNYDNEEGIAFSKEIMANLSWQKKEYASVIQLAFEAKNLYKKLDNFSAYAECMYLLALSLFEQEKLDDAEKILREIIKTTQDHPCCFHSANAYNLLGLIFLKKKDLRRAKGLFQQSLDLEQTNNRLGCIAADYANIGLIEFQSGNIEQAQKTLATALEYAEVNEDNELVETLRKRLEKLKG